MIANRWNIPHLGFGMGLRNPHYQVVLTQHPPIDFFEVISENFMESHGHQMYVLDSVRERYTVLLHGVSMSIGSIDPLNFEYLEKLKALTRRLRVPFVSDHLCWTSLGGHNSHDLLPVPLTEEALYHVAERVKVVQDFLELPLALENPSNYIEFTVSHMPEWEFLTRLCDLADCGLLLDVNNIYVSSFNHGFDPRKYVDAIPVERILYHHLAGHTHMGKYLLDTHSDYVIDPVWELYRRVTQRTGGRSTMVEWDEKIPAFEVVAAEVEKARRAAGGATPVALRLEPEDSTAQATV